MWVRVQAMVAELTRKLSACQVQLSSAQERCSQLDKEKQQAVADLQSTRQVSAATGLGLAWWSCRVCLLGVPACMLACARLACLSVWWRNIRNIVHAEHGTCGAGS